MAYLDTITLDGVTYDLRDTITREIIESVLINEAVSPTWEQGAINSATGANTNSTSAQSTRIRSGFINVDACISVAVPSGMKLYAMKYSEEGNLSSFVPPSIGWNENVCLFPGGSCYRFVLAYTEDTQINSSEGASVVITNYHFADSTLTMENKPAEAKAVRDIINQSFILRSYLTDGTDLNNVVDNGMYMLYQSGTYLNRPAYASSGSATLFVLSSTNRKVQFLLSDTSGKLFYRFQKSGTYQEWRQFTSLYGSMSAQTTLTEVDNLDTLDSVQGVYTFSVTSLPENIPLPLGGILIQFVFNVTYAIQVVVYVDGQIFHRYKRASGWTRWYNHKPDSTKYIGGATVEINEELTFEQGGIGSANGSDTNNKREFRIRTVNYWTVPVGRLYLKNTSSDHDIFIFRYEEGTRNYLGSSGWISDSATYEVHEGEELRFVVRYKDDSAILPASELPGICATTTVENTIDGLPVLSLTGDISEMTKDTAVSLNYSIFGVTGTCNCKWQGSSSTRYAKKNYTISNMSVGIDAWNWWIRWINSWRASTSTGYIPSATVYDTVTGREVVPSANTVSKWGVQTKYCLKANYVDPSAARNIACARLWSQVVASRANIIGKLDDSPNNGAIDGFPVILNINDEFVGLYTFNIPKTDYMFAMEESETPGEWEAVICGEDNSSSACKWTAVSPLVEGDYSIECDPDDNGAETILTSLNAAITAAGNAYNDFENYKTEFEQKVDVESVIDYFIFINCVAGNDNLARNILYGTYDGTKWFMSAYDLDTTFGSNPYGIGWFNAGENNTRNTFAKASEMHRLCNIVWNNYADDFVARYRELRKGVLSNANVWHELSQFVVNIPENAYLKDRTRWTMLPGTSIANIHQYMDFYKMHCAYLDREVEAVDHYMVASQDDIEEYILPSDG